MRGDVTFMCPFCAAKCNGSLQTISKWGGGRLAFCVIVNISIGVIVSISISVIVSIPIGMIVSIRF